MIGLGTVGRWLLEALRSNADAIAGRYGFAPVVVGVGRGRDGFIHDHRGLDLDGLLALIQAEGALVEHPGARHWDLVAEGLGATEADLLVEVSASPPPEGEPGLTHIREALRRRIPVVTSNKWPVALQGVELAALARENGVALRAESTVMSGTPVLSTLLEGLAGARPTGIRGVLNATANFILTAMASGSSYAEAVAEAQGAGLAERDPAADVDGHDSVAKLMVLGALVFDRQLGLGEVGREGIRDFDPVELEAAAGEGSRVRLVETIELAGAGGGAELRASVRPERLPAGDPLAAIEGATNALICRADPLGEVAVAGPGAGPALAGQGVLSDLIAVARTLL